MIIKPKIILLKTLLVLSSICISSCNSVTEKKSTILSIQEQKIDSIAIQEGVLLFLRQQQQFLRENKIDSIAQFVDFPLDDPCILANVFGSEFLNYMEENSSIPFPKTIDKQTFIQKKDSVYPSTHKYLFTNVDFKNLLDDKTYSLSTKKNNTLWNIYLYINYENSNFIISFSGIENEEEEFSIAHQYEYKYSKYILTKIYCIG